MGNFGLLAIVAALQWVQENIPAFEGDQSNVTLMGQGSEAAAAGLLVTSPVLNGNSAGLAVAFGAWPIPSTNL